MTIRSLVFLLFLSLPSAALADSLRCPGATIGAPGFEAEAPRIGQLWRDLGGPGSSGSDGPLGCPVGPPIVKSEAGWTGAAQKFQRGWILIGRAGSAGIEVAAVRGVGGWRIWWKGFPSNLVFAPTVPNDPFTQFPWKAEPAAWGHGGTTMIAPPTVPALALWKCDVSPCVQVTPRLETHGRPFDAAASLTRDRLTKPDAARATERMHAFLASWLPCYTLTPAADWTLGESNTARAKLMMTRTEACPITGASPQQQVLQWLSTLPAPDKFPGTSSDASQCPRKGELDVDLVQLLQLALQHQAALAPPVLDHLKDIFVPWGGKPRADQYVTPNGACLGYSIIETENHILLQESAKYLINVLVASRALGADYNPAKNRDWLLRFLRQLARRDFYEFNSMPYSRYQLKALFLLQQFAPDEPVRVSATGLLHWLFAKQALSGNLDRNHQPYRRKPTPSVYGSAPWWGDGALAAMSAAALLVGPSQHVTTDIDLELNDGKDPAGTEALTNVMAYPDIGAAPEGFLEAFTDLAGSSYQLPPVLVSWFEHRFTRDDANRVTYVQAFNHKSPILDEKELFAQPNSGQEIVSGNRNWTMIGGGSRAIPGDPGPPPKSTAAAFGYAGLGVAAGVVLGAAIGGLIGGGVGSAIGAVVGALIGLFGGVKGPDAIAADKQQAMLWSDQPGTFRETTLIPTAVGLDRGHTIRFAKPTHTSTDLNQLSRLCVAEGFMCGFDLQMPTRPFPARDASECPLQELIPPYLDTFLTEKKGFQDKPLKLLIGCQTKRSVLWHGLHRIWYFEYGTIIAPAQLPGGPGAPFAIAAAWLEEPEHGDNRRLRVYWDTAGPGYDWYRVHAYNHEVEPVHDEPPGGWFEPLPVIGDKDKVRNRGGEVIMPLKGVADISWDLLIVGCNTDPNIFAGHDCYADLWPKLSVTIAMPPRQPFSCGAHTHRSGRPEQVSQIEGVVLEVGESCSKSPYGMFTYIWTRPCSSKAECPPGALDYGFVVTAPSRGWSWQDFANSISVATMNLRDPSTVTVPISPPVMRRDDRWQATGLPSKHTITFRWLPGSGPAISADSGAPAYLPYSVDPVDWPTAIGRVTSPDASGAQHQILTNGGNGCMTLEGIPLPGDPDPMGMVIDLRSVTSPLVQNRRTSLLAGACS